MPSKFKKVELVQLSVASRRASLPTVAVRRVKIKMALSSAVSSTFNAFAFAGAGWIFSKINHGGYAKEIKRHDLAMERLTKDRDVWNQARARELDRLANLRYEKTEGLKDIENTNRDFAFVQTRFEKTKPLLKDYYKPSQEMKNYVDVVKAGMIVSGIALVALVV